MSFEPIHWTEADDERLIELRASGMVYRDIAKAMGKGPTAVRNRLIKLTPGHCLLRQAMIDAQVRFANVHRITLKEAQAVLMGGQDRERLPGTERVHKTASAARLVA